MTPAKRLIMMGSVRKYKNIVTNGNFANGTLNWSSRDSSNQVIAGNMINTGDGSNTVSYAQQSVFIETEHKYYVKGRARVTNSTCTLLRIQTSGSTIKAIIVSDPVANQWYEGSAIGVIAVDETIRILHTYETAESSNGKSVEIEYVIAVDLTTEFGAGNEPDLVWCDANIPQNIIW